ncbi:interleukin-13 receptor subunit alpha-1 [Anguilla anguilla]|uniref:interleukin-13 receptor subunit alpha-1 n=1 Tax=Anguilla anguilla TaxID=7936 RepID=UPI0015ABABF2|nr:interleukin-13 receptor subunit alpha-1 [Anguilla anguilla]
MNSAISADLLFKGFFLLTSCWAAFASVPSETGSLPPPSHLTVNFSSDFCVNLWWSPPENLSASAPAVKYLITATTQGGTWCTLNTFLRECRDTEDGVTYSVRAYPGSCERGTGSSAAVVTVPPRTEKLVKDFGCVYYTSGAMNCTWRPTDEARDLQLYYWYEPMPQALHCDHYLYSGRDKTGCHLYGDFLNFSSVKNEIFFLLNGTQGSFRRKNTFRVDPYLHMKPSPPNLSLNLTVEGHMLRLRCDPPAGFKASCWDCKYRYRSSGSAGWQERYKTEDKPVDVPYNRRLRYQVQVKAVCKGICGTGSSDWSETQSFGEEQSDWSFHVALVAIPVVVIVCVVLFLLFFKRLHVWILPQIPDPMTLFKELVNSKEAGGSHLTENAAMPHSKNPEKQMLYVPEEPELCVNVQVEEPDLAVTSP